MVTALKNIYHYFIIISTHTVVPILVLIPHVLCLKKTIVSRLLELSTFNFELFLKKKLPHLQSCFKRAASSCAFMRLPQAFNTSSIKITGKDQSNTSNHSL